MKKILYILMIIVFMVIFVEAYFVYKYYILTQQRGQQINNTIYEVQSSYATNNWKIWEDGYYPKTTKGFTYNLNYPRDFDVFTGDRANGNTIGNPVVKFAFPQDSFKTPPTNYGEAYITVSLGTDKTSVDGCYKNPNPNDDLSAVVTLNGIAFHTGNFQDAAAGNLYSSKLYRTLINNSCFETIETIHTGNIQNYPENTVSEFDKTKATGILDKMIESLTIKK